MLKCHAIALLAIVSVACATSPAPAPAPSTDRGAAPSSLAVPSDVRGSGDAITVDDFRRVCDALAEDILAQPFVTDAASPPVVTIRQLQNKTGLAVDDAIFQETIRVKLMQHAGGRVLFRDDVSYQDILKERLRASDEDVMVTLTDTVVDARTVDRNRDYGFEAGSLSGTGGKRVDKSTTQIEQRAQVSGGVAKADYFLRGIVYQMKEDVTSGRQGSYFQYQFRVVDARTGIIAWEQMLDSRPGDRLVKRVLTTPQTPIPVARQAAPATSPAAAPSPSTATPAPGGRVLRIPAPEPASDSDGMRVDSAPPAGTGEAPQMASTARGATPLVAAPAPSGEALPLEEIDFGRYHALVVGNEAYQSLPRLGAAANDARAVARTLETEYGFEVKLLIDAERRDIVSALHEYRRNLTASDNLLIYYAGHGWFDEEAKQGYWLPVEATEEDPSDWVSNATINDTLRANEANHVIVVADSCYSGTLTRGVTIRDKSARVFRKLSSRRSRTALSSGGLEPVEDDGGSGHSVFAEAFLRALRENPGVLDGQGLFAAVRRPVMVNADQSPEYGDIRKAGHDGGDFLFVRSR